MMEIEKANFSDINIKASSSYQAVRLSIDIYSSHEGHEYWNKFLNTLKPPQNEK
jgi:hypothetical protein